MNYTKHSNNTYDASKNDNTPISNWYSNIWQPANHLDRRRCHFCYHATWVGGAGWGGVGQQRSCLLCKHRIGYIMRSSLALAHVRISSLALAHALDATLWYLFLHLHNLAHTHTHLMLHYASFSGTESTNGYSGTIWQSDTTHRQQEKKHRGTAFCGQMIQTSISSFMKSRLKHVFFGVFL